MNLLTAVMLGFGAALLVPWLHRWLGDRLAWVVALIPLAISVCFGRMIDSPELEEGIVASYRWLPALDLSLSFYLDGLSLLFVLLIAGIGFVVVIYAGAYLRGSPQLGVFYAYLLVFMSAMLGLVLANNVLALYVFWELTTLSSFLLIGFEHEKKAARQAALKSLLTTTVGGLALLIGLVLLGMAGESFQLSTLMERGERLRQVPEYPVILGLILLAVMTKSAQFPFHFWLPSAMEAPTPVSAYLHSATMVKAGVYLLARMLPVLGDTPLWHAAVTSVGAATMLLGAFVAFYQHDLKRILAYLTINVLGTLVVLLGLGTKLAVQAAITYLLAHALYKGALFLVAGAVDHATHTRNLNELGGLWRKMPLTMAAAVLAAISMAGLPPLFGFIAKEMYFDAAWHAEGTGWLLASLSVAASLFLVAMGVAVAWHPFFARETRFARGAHEAAPSMWIGPLVMATAGVVLGLLPQKLATPLIEPAVTASFATPASVELKLWHGMNAPLLMSIAAVILGAVAYALRDQLLARFADNQFAIRWGADAWYERAISGLRLVARWQTRVLQHGYLRLYVAVIVGVLVLLVGSLVGITIAHVGHPFAQRVGIGVHIYEAVAVGLIALAALVAVRSRSRLRAVASLGVVGFSASWIYALFGAPDLAMTQIVVEALTVLLFVLVFYHLPQFTQSTSRSVRLRDGILAISAGTAIAALLLVVTNFKHHESISYYYAQEAYRGAHGRNVVNVILVDFRALDTLGEITVLATAALGVFALAKLVLKEKVDL